jgi:hypothetical protein
MKSNAALLLTLVALGLLTATFNGCQSGPSTTSIKNYYYPIPELLAGKVYVYEMKINETALPDYWYFKTMVRDSGTYLSSTNYDDQFHINQMVLENTVENGTKAKEFLVFEQDSSNGKAIQTRATLLGPDIFPFEVTDSLGVFLFHVAYHPASDPTSTLYLIRNRRYLGEGPVFSLDGRNYPTVRFRVKEAIGNEKEGSAEIEGTGEEWYAKDLGLVYYRKTYGQHGELVREYQLKERINMADLEKRAAGNFLSNPPN